jgi:hypothetical protein
MTGAGDQAAGWRADRGEAAGHPRPLHDYPPVLLAAGVLAAEDVSSVLVGSAALWLRGEPIHVGDLDLVIEPDGQNLRRLHAALAQMAPRPGSVPLVSSFQRLALVTVLTSYGKIDCLLERGRLDWERLRRAAALMPVADAGVLVADAADAWALRRRFKG